MCSSFCKHLIVFTAGAAIGMIAMPYLTQICDNNTCNCLTEEIMPNVCDNMHHQMRKFKHSMKRKF